jgi:hypothetical protein
LLVERRRFGENLRLRRLVDVAGENHRELR